MSEAIEGVDRSAPASRGGTDTSIRSGSAASSTDIASSAAADTAPISTGRSSRKRNPSRKFLENAATESLLQDEVGSRPTKKRRPSPSDVPPASSGDSGTTEHVATEQDSNVPRKKRRPSRQKTSSSNRFKRTDRKEALERCNFSDTQSINLWYKPYKGKGQINVPMYFLSQLTSKDAKAKFVREWRMLSTDQQIEKMEAANLLSAAESEQLRVNAVKPPTKSKLDRLRDKDYVAGEDEMDEEFQLVLGAEEEQEGFLSPKRLSNKQIYTAAKKRVREKAFNKKRREQRKSNADEKVSICFICFFV